MSLTLSLRTALSGLQLNQASIQLTSNNVANVNTEGYTRKTLEPLSRIVGGAGAGVLSSEVIRKVDQNLIKDLRTQLMNMGVFRVEDEFYTRMQDFFGTPENSASLTASIATFVERAEALSAFPEDITLAQQLVAGAKELAKQMNTMATNIQDLRSLADTSIADSVKIINTELAKVATLNREITRNTAIGLPKADLEDQRDLALNKIANHIDITYFFRNSGDVVVQTKSGASLLDGTAATVTHTQAGAVDATIVYPSAFDAITVNGLDITTSIQSGRIKGMIDMRDTTLPNLQAQIDAIATKLRDEINKVHNDGAGLPAPDTLTGTLTGLANGTAFAGTGVVRIAVIDANGNALAAPLDFNLASVANIGDLVTAINTGLGTFGSASLSSTGQLVINATNANNGIVINENTSDVTATSRGFSHHFGLNDFFVGDATVSFARNIAVRADIVTNPQRISRGEIAGPPAIIIVGGNAVPKGDNSVISRLAQALSANISFSAVGGLPPITGNFVDYSAQILSTNAAGAANADDNLRFREAVLQDLKFRVSSKSGVNIDEEMATLVMLQSAFAANARVFSVTTEMIRILEDMTR